MTGFRYPLLVRWSDLDSYGHVNNVRYFDYLQEARVAFLAELFGSGDDDFFRRTPALLVSQTLDYLRPMLLRQAPYDVDVTIDAIGTSSYTMGSRIVDRTGGAEVVYARGTSVLVAVSADSHAKRPLGGDERAALERGVAPA